MEEDEENFCIPRVMTEEERKEYLAEQQRNAAECGCDGLCDSGYPCPMPKTT